MKIKIIGRNPLEKAAAFYAASLPLLLRPELFLASILLFRPSKLTFLNFLSHALLISHRLLADKWECALPGVAFQQFLIDVVKRRNYITRIPTHRISILWPNHYVICVYLSSCAQPTATFPELRAPSLRLSSTAANPFPTSSFSVVIILRCSSLRMPLIHPPLSPMALRRRPRVSGVVGPLTTLCRRSLGDKQTAVLAITPGLNHGHI